MLRSVKAFFAVCLAAPLAACVTAYVEPQGPTATLHMQMSDTLSGLGDQQRYFISSDENNSGIEISPYLHRFGIQARTSDDRQIAAGSPIYVQAGATIFRGMTPQANTYSDCFARVTFVPRVGAVYNAQHDVEAGRCSLTLVDSETGRPPADLQILPALPVTGTITGEGVTLFGPPGPPVVPVNPAPAGGKAANE